MALSFDKGFSFYQVLAGTEVDIEDFRHGKNKQSLFGEEGEGINSLKLKGT